MPWGMCIGAPLDALDPGESDIVMFQNFDAGIAFAA
jgi:hypothetical protein